MTIAQVKKALGGFLAALPTILFALVAHNLIDNDVAVQVSNVLVALTPFFVALGVYKAPANEPPPTPVGVGPADAAAVSSENEADVLDEQGNVRG